MASRRTRLPGYVTRKMKHYVYLYVHRKTGKVLYVGKGQGNRAFAHVPGSARVEFLMHGLPDAETAHLVETAAIDLVQPEANIVRGHKSHAQGRMTLDQVISLYQQKPARITEPAVLIRISKAYRYGMDPVELYDATRAAWRVNPGKKAPRYALAVYQGIVREVYAIHCWLPAGSTFSTRHPRGVKARGRYEFVGTVAPEHVRKKYMNRAVGGYFTQGGQNPIQYVNC